MRLLPIPSRLPDGESLRRPENSALEVLMKDCQLRRHFFAVLAASVATSAMSQSLREQLVGNWTLVSWERHVDGVREPGVLGSAPVGHHIFTADGFFCTAAMAPDRRNFASPDVLSATAQEQSEAFGTFISYCGRYETIESEKALLLRPNVSWFPNWTGTTLRRTVEVDGDRAVFRFSPPGAGARKIEGVFVWQRVK